MGSDCRPTAASLRCTECGSVWLSGFTRELIAELGGCLLCNGAVEEIPPGEALGA